MRNRVPKNQRQSGSHTLLRSLAVVGAGTLILGGIRLYSTFFGPILRYSVENQSLPDLKSEEFRQFLSTVTAAPIRPAQLTRLRNGAEFYRAELDSIRQARFCIDLEFYEFHKGRVADEMLAALCERARAGVAIRLLADAIGSFPTPDSYFDGLRAAGGRMFWHHPLHWNTWQKANNRTHRKLLIVDGKVGYLGGAGIADHWLYRVNGVPAWRDTVFRVEGGGVSGFISTFSENWLEAAGEILSEPQQFAAANHSDGAHSLVVSSTPHGGGTRARILFQLVIKSARKSIQITTPYFLPDRSARQALIEAIRERGVEVRILTAGPKIDHALVRRLSRHSSRHLLEAGAEIYEYQPSMIHAKLLTIDGQWNVIGSTNFDHRSFALNDEVNMAILDPELAQVITADFEEDLRSSQRLTLELLQSRGLIGSAEKVMGKAVRRES